MANPVIGDLTTTVERTKTVVESAVVLIGGINARVNAAVEAAIANGATEAELAPVRDAVAALTAETDALAAAVANVPA